MISIQLLVGSLRSKLQPSILLIIFIIGIVTILDPSTLSNLTNDSVNLNSVNAAPSGSSTVIITEIGASNEILGHDWVELFALASTDVDGWLITDLDGTELFKR